ncbi:MAG: hypothetical protein LC798_14165 [Chloroflexi bacterium]|nr:hypothetical protein [Chloroflexota bacterium]
MIDRTADPRTEDTLVYELLQTPRGATEPRVIGQAIFRGGRTVVEAPDGVRIAVEELLSRTFVDRVQADERPRGYRRSGTGMVDMLVPGMAEHFIARLRGLWLSYPDGSVVTARPGGAMSTIEAVTEPSDTGAPVTDTRIRRSTLASADRRLGTRPLVRAHAPEDGRRPEGELGIGHINRTDCGWIS